PQVVVDEGRVLFRIEHLEERRGGIAGEVDVVGEVGGVRFQDTAVGERAESLLEILCVDTEAVTFDSFQILEGGEAFSIEDASARTAGPGEIVRVPLVFQPVEQADATGRIGFATPFLDFDVALEGSGTEPPTSFRRGDADATGRVDITDGIYIFSFLFLGGERPSCMEAADADFSGTLNITDGIFLLGFLFIGGALPPEPGPVECGPIPEGAVLGCELYPNC
ncbi:MAG: hypothetical protein AAF517_16800, partial [Planctomycetota bacterium]